MVCFASGSTICFSNVT